MINRPTGTIIAPPMPCTNRASTNPSRLRAVVHVTEPRRKITIAAAKTFRAPKRSATQPLGGMKIARLIRYEVSASFRDSGSTCRDRAIVGSAVEMIVLSMFSMKRAVATTRAIVLDETDDIAGSRCATASEMAETSSGIAFRLPVRTADRNRLRSNAPFNQGK